MSGGDDALIGETVGGYRIEGRIGAGATGVVYRARKDGDEDAEVLALKVLHNDLGSISGLEGRFRREARVLDRLSHPNLVSFSDFGTDEGRTFIAMELLEGETLEDRLSRGALDPQHAVIILRSVLSAMAVAHEHQVVHRDLKPANVFMLKDGGVKLLDFGLAKMLSVDDVHKDGTLTRKGRIVGTPAYMAPEQITGVFIDVRADVYALGIVLFELLADRRPFLAERRSELLRSHLLDPVPWLAQSRDGLWVADELEELVHRALEKDPEDRYADAGEMLTALKALPDPAARFSRTKKRAKAREQPSHAVISAAERAEITESAGISASTSNSNEVRRPSRGEETEKVKVHRPPPAPEGVSTGSVLLFGFALLLALVAGWFFYGN